jgi:hypothetical protein
MHDGSRVSVEVYSDPVLAASRRADAGHGPDQDLHTVVTGPGTV